MGVAREFLPDARQPMGIETQFLARLWSDFEEKWEPKGKEIDQLELWIKCRKILLSALRSVRESDGKDEELMAGLSIIVSLFSIAYYKATEVS